MRKLVGILGLVLIVIIGGFVFMKRDYLFGFGKQAMRSAKGLTPAKTPQEAVDKFRIAIQSHDYEAAATYLTGDYAEQMNRGSAAANKLAVEIENLSSQMKTREKTSDQGQYILRVLAPFPTEFEIEIKKQGEDKAVGVITDKSEAGFKNINPNDLPKMDLLMVHALFPQKQLPFEFKQETISGEKVWKMNFPMNAGMTKSVERLNAKSADYVQALGKVKHDVQHEAMTGKDIEGKLKAEFEGLAK